MEWKNTTQENKMTDAMTISFNALLDGSLESGTDASVPKVKCDLCDTLIEKVDGDDDRTIICNACYFSMDENI